MNRLKARLAYGRYLVNYGLAQVVQALLWSMKVTRLNKYRAKFVQVTMRLLKSGFPPGQLAASYIRLDFIEFCQLMANSPNPAFLEFVREAIEQDFREFVIVRNRVIEDGMKSGRK